VESRRPEEVEPFIAIIPSDLHGSQEDPSSPRDAVDENELETIWVPYLEAIRRVCGGLLPS
jgi:hypothetical protein